MIFRDMFSGYIAANLRLYSLRNGGMKLSTHAAANFTRGELAKALRSRSAYQVNVLIAGYDDDDDDSNADNSNISDEKTEPPSTSTSTAATTTNTKSSKGGKASLYFLDYLSTLHKQNTAAHGYGAFFSLALLDKGWRPGLELDEATQLIKKCIDEVQKRLVVAPSAFQITKIDKQGVTALGMYPEQ